MVRNAKLIKLITPIIIFTAAILLPIQAKAINYSDFKPGRIIDDVVFTNKSSMSADQIQAFLSAKVPICDTQHSPYTGGSGTVYYAPFTCLKDYQENILTGENNYGKYASDNVTPTAVNGGKTAAQIIWQVAQEYNINPQVLIVLLQKEQGLITDTWPILPQYTKATGYLCPDTAPCSSAASGFYKQVAGAGWQLRNDFNGIGTPGFWSPFTKGVNNILYSPNAACGTRSVNIETQATAVLYKYTPYTPNDAAILAAPGVDVPCGSYGNRNFWRMFNDWFGSTTGIDYEWQYEKIEFSTGTTSVVGGSEVEVVLYAKNIGNQTWSNTNNPIRLATWAPTNHNSALYHSSWVSRIRPATLTEYNISPGEIGTFRFKINIPQNYAGIFLNRFNLVAEGVTWMPDNGFTLRLEVSKPTFTWQMISQSSSKGFNLQPGEQATFTMQVRNTGNVTWSNTNNPVRMATFIPTNRSSVFYDSSWLSSNRPATLTEAAVMPGQIGTFTFKVNAPKESKSYIERFNLVMEGVSWFVDPWLEFQVQVGTTKTWRMISQSSSTGSFAIPRNTSSTFTMQVQNTGNVAWSNINNPVRLATFIPTNRNSKFYDSSWLSSNRPAVLTESTVPPGATGTFTFKINTPPTPGMYVERFNLVAEGLFWLDDPWLEFQILVL